MSRTVVFIVCLATALISTYCAPRNQQQRQSDNLPLPRRKIKGNLEDVRSDSAMFHNRKAEAIKLVEETGKIDKKGLSGLKERFKRKTIN
ncbi:hypothetical protein QQG55_21570 [Brugia pahangi]